MFSFKNPEDHFRHSANIHSTSQTASPTPRSKIRNNSLPTDTSNIKSTLQMKMSCDRCSVNFTFFKRKVSENFLFYLFLAELEGVRVSISYMFGPKFQFSVRDELRNIVNQLAKRASSPHMKPIVYECSKYLLRLSPSLYRLMTPTL